MANLFLPTSDTGSNRSGFPVASTRDGAVKTRLFTATGTWTCPANVYWVYLEMCGGGGGGGSTQGSPSTNNGASADGGAGAAAVAGTVRVLPGVTYTCTVASGGAGAPASGNARGSSGGTSSFVGSDGVLKLFAPGGGGGEGGSTGAVTSRTAAVGGYTTPATTFYGASVIPGGAGGTAGYGNGANSVAPTAGGAVDGVMAGISLTSTSLNNSGAGGASAFGRGADAVASSPNSVAGATATEYGGGGSGAAIFSSDPTARAGGNGAAGFVRLTWEE